MTAGRRQLKMLLSPLDRKILRDLPDSPGIYIMQNAAREVLYVGKAQSLRQRVRSYFQRKTEYLDNRIIRMLSMVRHVDYNVTGSVLEAAVLESDAIKNLMPRYNRALRSMSRQPWFCSTDFKHYSPVLTNDCAIGPVSSPLYCRILRAVKDMIKNHGAVSPADLLLLLRDPQYDPERDRAAVEDGVSEFLKEHGDRLCRKPFGVMMQVLGKDLYRQHGAKYVDEDRPADHSPDKNGTIGMSAADVRHVLESHVVRCACELRKARWYTLLSESTLAWTERLNRRYRRIAVVIEKGQIVDKLELLAESELPVPPGYYRKCCERRQYIDLAALDRLKVMTTEIKRLIASKRWINLRLSPDVVMDKEKLQRLLRWM